MKNEVIDNVSDLEEMLFEPNVFRIVNYTDAVVASYFQTHPDIQFRPVDDSYDPFDTDTYNEEIRIFPNPFSASINISNTDEPILVEIINLEGKVLQTERIGTASSGSIIRTDQLSPGLYLIRLIQNDKISNHKLVKQ